MSDPKSRAKMELNAEKTSKASINTPRKPKKPEDKKQSGFTSTSVSAKFGKIYGGMVFPSKKPHKKKGWQK